VVSCEYGNESSVSVKFGEFLDQVSDLACERGLFCSTDLVILGS
jgi:hypothetical protein